MRFKKIALFFSLFIPRIVIAGGACGITGTQQTVFNPFTGKLDYVCVYVGGGGGGGSSTLAVDLGNVIISSPTAVVNFSSNTFTANQSPTGQANIGINFSSVASQSDLSKYLTLSSATATYFQISSSGTFLSISSATANFLTQSSATATYLNKNSIYVSSVNVTNALTVTANGTSGSTPVFGVNFSSVASVSSIPLPGGSDTNVQINKAGSFYGDGGFQYDSSVSSVTINGRLGIFVNGSWFFLDSSSSDPFLTIDDENGSPGGGINFQYFGVNKARFRNTGTYWGIEASTDSSTSSVPRLNFPQNNQHVQFVDPNSVIYADFDALNSSGSISGQWSAKSILDTSLASGQCVQTGAGGLLTVTGSACGSGGGGTSVSAFGGIYTSSGNVRQTNISTTPVKLSVFSANGDSNQTTPSFSSAQITVSTTAAFNIFANIVSTGVGNFNQFFWIAVNGSTTVFSCQDTPSARCTFSGIKNLNSGDVVTILTSVNLIGNSTITVIDAQLYVSAVGGSGGSGGGSTGGVSVYPATSTIIASAGISGIFDISFDAAQAKLPGSNTPFISNSTNEISASVYFDDTSTQSCTWSGLVTKYDGRPLFADIIFTSTATSGTINWGIYTATNTPNLDSFNYDSSPFNTIVTTSSVVNAAGNGLSISTVQLSNTVTANGQIVVFKLEREAGLLDTSVGFGRVKKLRIYE